ncbi:MAG: hypothetical protein AAF327_09840 [Cyanobacteria bacterium P01_A01_bin.37]
MNSHLVMDRINVLENLDLDQEYDDGFDMTPAELNDPITQSIANERIVLCGDEDNGERAYEGTSYIWVAPDYDGQLSPGQRELYGLLKSFQEAAVYTATTIGKLAEAQGLQNPLACCTRLENLQSLGAIHGLKI